MKLHHIYILFFFFCVSCSNHYKKKLEPVDIIPDHHHTIIKLNSTTNLNNSLITGQIKIDSVLQLTKFIETNAPIYYSFSEKNASLVTTYTDSLILRDSILGFKTVKINSRDILKTTHQKDTIYHKRVDSLYFVSKNFELVNAINENINPELRTYFSTTNKESSLSILFRNKEKNEFLLNQNNTNALKYEIIDIQSDAKKLIFNGIAKSTDSTFSLNAFKNTIPQKFNLANIIPNDAISFQRIAFDDYSIFSENLKNLRLNIENLQPSVFDLSNEIAQIEVNTGKAIAINFLDTEVIKTEIDQNSIAETYKGIPIFNFQKSDIFSQNLQPFITQKNVSYGFTFQNVAVFSDDLIVLKEIISSKLNNNVLAESEEFKNSNQELASASSYIIYKNKKGLADYLGKNTEGYNISVVQYIYDTDFAHINGIYSKYKKGGVKNSVSEDFSFKISNEILAEPQTIKNHITGGRDIVIQDVTNTLYQISNSGRIIWKRKIDGPILGKIEQIDSYKNGRFQIAFATKNRIYVIDRKGKDVGLFPIKFNDDITQPLSVFDYDKRKKYRLLVTQNNQLLMYDTKGKRVKGFKYKKGANKITSQPKHFRINSKDYIVFSQGEKLEILNRQGKQRIAVNEAIEFSNSEIFNYKNTFTTKAKNGYLAQVDTRGKLKLSNYNLKPKSELTSTSKTLVTLTENELKINTKTIDLDFGNYTAPRIFYLNDKIYITITDLQARKVWVYDSQAKLLTNFPVYGTSSAIIEKLEKNKDISLITQSDNQSVIVYKIN